MTNAKVIQQSQTKEAEKHMRFKCLEMALDYHRTVENKNGFAIDIDMLEPLETPTPKGKKKSLSISDTIKVWTQTGILCVKSRDAAGNTSHARVITQLNSPTEITTEMVLATANKFYNYIVNNKQK